MGRGGRVTRHSGQSTVALETKEPHFPVLGKLHSQIITLTQPSNLECNIYSTVERGNFISVYGNNDGVESINLTLTVDESVITILKRKMIRPSHYTDQLNYFHVKLWMDHCNTSRTCCNTNNTNATITWLDPTSRSHSPSDHESFQQNMPHLQQ